MVGTNTWTADATRWVCQKRSEGLSNEEIVAAFKQENPRWLSRKVLTVGSIGYMMSTGHSKFFGASSSGGKDCFCQKEDTQNPEHESPPPNSELNGLIDPRLQEISHSRADYHSPANPQNNQIDSRDLGNGSPSGSRSREHPHSMPEARMTSGHPQSSEPISNRLENQFDSSIDLQGPHPHAPWPSSIDPALFNYGSQTGTNDGHQRNPDNRYNPGGVEQHRKPSASPHNDPFPVNDATGQNASAQGTPPSRNSNVGQDVRRGVTLEQEPLQTSVEPIYPGKYPHPTDEIMAQNEQRKKGQEYHPALKDYIGRQPVPTMNTLNKPAPMAASQQMAGAGNNTQQGRRGQPSNGVAPQFGRNVAFTDPHLAQQENGYPPPIEGVAHTYQNDNHDAQNQSAAAQFRSLNLNPEIHGRLSQLPNFGFRQGLTPEQLRAIAHQKELVSASNQQVNRQQQAPFHGSQLQNGPLTPAQQRFIQQRVSQLQSQSSNEFTQIPASQGEQYGSSQATPKSSPGKAKRKRSPSKAATNPTPASTAAMNYTPGIQNAVSPALTNSSPAMNHRPSNSSGQKSSVPASPLMVHPLGKLINANGEIVVKKRERSYVKLRDLLQVHPDLYVAVLGSRVSGSNSQPTPQTTSTQQVPRLVSTIAQAPLQQFQNGLAKQEASYSEEFSQENFAIQERFAMQQREAAKRQALQAFVASQPNIGGAQAAAQKLSSAMSGSPQYMPRNPLTALPPGAFGLIDESPSQPTKSFLMSPPGMSSPHTPQQGTPNPNSSHAAAVASSRRLQHAQRDGQMFLSPHAPQVLQEVQRSPKRPREESPENVGQKEKRLKVPHPVQNNAVVSEATVVENTFAGNGVNATDSLAQGAVPADDMPTLPDSAEEFTSDLNLDFGSWEDMSAEFDTQNWATSPTGNYVLPTEEPNTGNTTRVEQAPSPKTHTLEAKDPNTSTGQGASVEQGASVAPQMIAEEHLTTAAPGGGKSAGYEGQEALETEVDNDGQSFEFDEDDDPIRKVFEDFMRDNPQCAVDDLPGVWGGNVESAEDSDLGSPNAPADRAPSPLQLQVINWEHFDSFNQPEPMPAGGDLTIGVKQEQNDGELF